MLGCHDASDGGIAVVTWVDAGGRAEAGGSAASVGLNVEAASAALYSGR